MTTDRKRKRQVIGVTVYLGSLATAGLAVLLIAWLQFNVLNVRLALAFGMVVLYALVGIRHVNSRYQYLYALEDRGVARDIVATLWASTLREMAMLFFALALAFPAFMSVK